MAYGSTRMRVAGAVFFDFKNPCPSVARAWSFAALATVGVPAPLLQLFWQMYNTKLVICCSSFRKWSKRFWRSWA